MDELAAAVVGDDAIAHVEKQRVELVALVLHGFERGVEHGRHVVECGGQNADLVRRFDSKRFVEVAGRDALGALGQFFNGVDHGLGEQERQKHRDEKTDEQCLQNDEQQLRVQRRDRGATVADVDDEAVVAAGDGDGNIHIACGKVAVVADLAVARGEDIFRLLKQLAVLVARSKHFAAAAVENIVVAVARVNAQCAGVGLEHRLQAHGAVLLRINRRFVLKIQSMYPGNQDKVKNMAILYDGQVKMAHLAIAGSYSVNGVAALHTKILEERELKDFYEMRPEQFNNKTNGITQRRFLLHGNPLLASWITDKIGDEWIVKLSNLKKLKVYATDEKYQQEFMNIKYQNKIRLANYIKEHNGVDVDPRSIFDVQVKRLHEYKRQLLNILHVMYQYNELKTNPSYDMYPTTYIFGAKASAGYKRAKLIIKLINSVADVINNDASIKGKIKVVFIENYRVSNAELIFAAADVSEQISTASREASGTGNMKFMLNGAVTLGTMDGANVEIVEEVGEENAVIFGLRAEEVMKYEREGGYNPKDIYNNDAAVRTVLTQLINGMYSSDDPDRFRDLYDSLINEDVYFILKDFASYVEAHRKIDTLYRDEKNWAKMVMLNTACSGKFSSDRTIEEYAKEIWNLKKVKVTLD